MKAGSASTSAAEQRTGRTTNLAAAGGDLLVVDESAMTDTASLSAIHGYAEAGRGRSCCWSATTASSPPSEPKGGDAGLLAAAGSRYELADARRFDEPMGAPGRRCGAAHRRRGRAQPLPPPRSNPRRRHRDEGQRSVRELQGHN
ncbi:hypothetical protein HBB16_17460 [Pseudonocardia sp. MCCB 268]|nr:hypothetical protein [Pseudonocardia cytotoxica]